MILMIRDELTGECDFVADNRTHLHWAVMPSRGSSGPWCIQLAGREGLGTRYDPPKPEHSNFMTKKAAIEYKKRYLG